MRIRTSFGLGWWLKAAKIEGCEQRNGDLDQQRMAIIAQMKSRPSAAAVLAMSALAIFTVWITWQAKALERLGRGGSGQKSALWNKQAPAIALPGLDGRIVSLAEYRGKKQVIITYWASWCGPCRMELPVLGDFYARAKKAGAAFEILAINIDEYKDSAEGAAKELKLAFPVLLDPHQKAAGDYGVASIPALFVIDKTGKVAFNDIGFNPALDFILAQQLGIDPSAITKGTPGDSSGH
jgi:peroxiredoxin